MTTKALWLAIGLGAFLIGAPAQAGTDPTNKCVDSKAKAAGKKAQSLLKAIGKNLSKNPDTKLAANISKAQSKLTKGFTKAESKGSCFTTGDAATIEAKIDAFVDEVVVAQNCGDNALQGIEECDGTADAACPGACLSDCTCDVCGNDTALPPEECDGTDDSACPGACLGDCTCDFCGNDIAAGTEECDGTDSSPCQGICQPNCICPEPKCGNGVLEAGEDCDTICLQGACGAGEICGVDCTCVTPSACSCGSPDPTALEYRIFGGSGTCGSVKDAFDTELKPLACGNGYVGGGQLGAAPPATPVPLGGTSVYNVECCYGNTLALGPSTVGETGDIETCTSEDCLVGAPVPVIVSPIVLSVCTIDTLFQDGYGSADCSTGEASLELPIFAPVFLTGDTLQARCDGGTSSGAKCEPSRCSVTITQRCNVDSDCPASQTCVPSSTCVNTASPIACTDDSDCPGGSCGCPGGGASCLLDNVDIQPCPICNPTTLTCAGGPNNGQACTPGTPLSGPGIDARYPTSQDCPPSLTLNVSNSLNPYSLTTTNQMAEASDGQFCKFCRDRFGDASLCFEGHPDPGQANGCPDSALLDCKPASGSQCAGGTNAGASCSDNSDCDSNVCDPRNSECFTAVPCNSDADCFPPYESCEQRNAGAADEPTAVKIEETSSSPAGDLTDRAEHSALLSSVYCLPPTLVDLTDGNADFPGPGAVAQPATLKLVPSPSGAFVDALEASLN